MSYPISLVFYTTPGIADLRAQLFSSVGVNVGAAITTGFVERGSAGMYILTCAVPDGHYGGGEIYSAATPSNILAVWAIASNEVENLDAKVSSGVVLSTAVMQAMADTLLGRSVATVEGTASAHSLAEMILGLLESSTAGTTWTIKRTDGTTTFSTRTLALDSTALPVTGVS